MLLDLITPRLRLTEDPVRGAEEEEDEEEEEVKEEVGEVEVGLRKDFVLSLRVIPTSSS